MTLARPLLFLAAIASLAALAWLFGSVGRRARAQALAYSNVAFALDALRPARWPAALVFAGFVGGGAALALALGGPHFVTRVPTGGGTVVLCIDTSGSMRAMDLRPTRADAARTAALAFVDAVPLGTRIGVVTFASSAILRLPPTDDRDAVRDALGRLPAPDGGTAMGDALALAAQALPAKGRRIVVLLTDGVTNRGTDPIAVSQNMGSAGVKIETVGVGSSGSGEIIPGTNEEADLDENGLREVAQNGNGRYVAANEAGKLSDAFRGIAFDTVWEKKRIDGSLPFALGGGALLVLTLLGGFAAGRFP